MRQTLGRVLTLISFRKYKFMEQNLISQKKGVMAKLPDIKSALGALNYLMNREVSRRQRCRFADP